MMAGFLRLIRTVMEAVVLLWFLGVAVGFVVVFVMAAAQLMAAPWQEYARVVGTWVLVTALFEGQGILAETDPADRTAKALRKGRMRSSIVHQVTFLILARYFGFSLGPVMVSLVLSGATYARALLGERKPVIATAVNDFGAKQLLSYAAVALTVACFAGSWQTVVLSTASTLVFMALVVGVNARRSRMSVASVLRRAWERLGRHDAVIARLSNVSSPPMPANRARRLRRTYGGFIRIAVSRRRDDR